jgi:xanthine dehydrogenase accessory factor
MKEFYVRLLALLEEHRRLAVATVVRAEGSTPRESGAKMLVLPDGSTHGTVGGGALEKAVTADALRALGEGRGFIREYSLRGKRQGGIGAMCGGKATVLVEVLGAGERLLVCGGGHIGLSLARMGAELGFRVTVVEPRRDYSSAGRFPEGVEILRARPADRRALSLVDADTYVVILTHSHLLDKEALRALAPSAARYIGMIGSREKVRRVLAELAREGVERGSLRRVHAPVGLDIGAETPAEIAVAILAEMVHVRRRSASSPVSLRLVRGAGRPRPHKGGGSRNRSVALRAGGRRRVR